jgi:hypothetical protein
MINCSNCISGKHDKCFSPESCLCANDSHGESLRYGVKIELDSNEPKFFEKCQSDRERLDELMDSGIGENSPEYIIPEMVKLMIGTGHLVSKIDILKVLKQWGVRFGVKADYDGLIEFAWSDADTFQMIKQICFEKGKRKIKTVFDSSQNIEASYYLMGRYHIKRIELTGNLIFFNDKYYEKNAEPLIRRKARQLLIKSKNGDMNEIVKLIEDSCQLIKWSDIENSIHIKCLQNGLYDIKKGVFTSKFNPDFIILNEIPHEYDIMKSWKNIDEKVSEIITDERDRESYYDSLSTALHPYTGIDFQFGGIGQPGTGKSQLCQLSIMTLGDDNVSASPIHLVASDLTTQKDVAFNFLNIDMDMSNETIRNIDVLKRWITQDKFTARGIYEHNTTFRPMARMCFMANDLYEIANSDDAEAIYERTHIIKLNNKFRGSEDQIKNLFQKIATEDELSGFVTYLLRNATDIYNNQRIRHPINIQSVRNIWNLHGNRIKEFCETWIERGDFREETSDVWNRWLSFTHLKDYPAKDKKKFYQIFDEIMGNSPIRTRMGKGDESRSVYAYSGFRLLRDEEINKDKQETFGTVQDSPKNIFGAFHAQSSKSSILSLLKITQRTTNYKLLEAKIIELLELYDYSRGDKS